jgi:phosphoribosylanthranilate isomerase
VEVHRTRIKFCGITRSQDAIAAAAAGADAIGLIFWEQSSRYISVQRADEILQALPPMITPVGLFVNAEPKQIRHTANTLNIRTIQLHGDERPEMLAELAEFTVIKAIKFDAAKLDLWTEAAARWKNLSGLLLETVHAHAPGGTGIENDWAGIDLVLKSRRDLPPLIAAGGLTPENVGAVVRMLSPYAVDVSTGIEESRGVKSVDKMYRFAEEVLCADHGE